MGNRPPSIREEQVEETGWNQLEKRFDQLVSTASKFYGPEKTEVMDPKLSEYLQEGNSSGFIELLSLSVNPLSTFLNNSTPNGNTLLHLAAGSRSGDIVKLLVRFSDLVVRTNSQDDTPLHFSARSGNIEAAIVLVNYAEEHPNESLLKKKNKKGNTALHDAVIEKHQNVAKSLIKADPAVAYVQNGELKCPLYLAAQNGDMGMLSIILQAVSEHKYPITLLEGKSPAYAAIENRDLDMLSEMERLEPELIRYKDGKKEEIPLHFASRKGYFEGVEFLLQKHRAGAFERNKKGLYPIHVACRKGHINVVDRLFKEWPDPMELLTGKGQSILHVSAENGRENLVDHLLQNPEIVKIADEKDADGNTALHLGAMKGRSMAVYSLVKSKKVDWQILNHKNMAPFQVVEQRIIKLQDERRENGTKPKKQKLLLRLNYYEMMMTSAILHFHGSRRKSIKDYMRIPSRPLSKDELKTKIGNLLLVAILVASVTFAGAVQIPGGKGKDDDGGAPASHGALLKVYIYLDVMALNASIMAALILCWAKITTHLVWLASILIGAAIYLMCLAFVFAAAIAVSESAVAFSVLMLVSSLLFLLQTVLSVPLIFPPNLSKATEKFVSPYVYYGTFEVYSAFRKAVAKSSNPHNHHTK